MFFSIETYIILRKYERFFMYKKVTAVLVLGIIFSVAITLIANGVNEETNTLYKIGKKVVISNGKYEMTMDVEQFIPCVLMAQLDVDSPIELLKAQAVVIRTYILYSMGSKEKIKAQELGLPYCTYAQMRERWYEDYRRKHAATGWGMFYNLTDFGKTKVYDEKMACIHKVMEKTRGKVLKYQGKMILPLFHRISNGQTRAGESALGSDYRYLKSIPCDKDEQEDEFLSVRYFTLEEFLKKLSENGIVIYKDKEEKYDGKNSDVHEFISMMDLSNVDENGYQLWVRLGDTKVNGDVFREALGLRSTSMKIEEYEQGIRITTKGDGHGFGMSLSFARSLAENGANWGDILRKFYDCVIVDY